MASRHGQLRPNSRRRGASGLPRWEAADDAQERRAFVAGAVRGRVQAVRAREGLHRASPGGPRHHVLPLVALLQRSPSAYHFSGPGQDWSHLGGAPPEHPVLSLLWAPEQVLLAPHCEHPGTDLLLRERRAPGAVGEARGPIRGSEPPFKGARYQGGNRGAVQGSRGDFVASAEAVHLERARARRGAPQTRVRCAAPSHGGNDPLRTGVSAPLVHGAGRHSRVGPQQRHPHAQGERARSAPAVQTQLQGRLPAGGVRERRQVCGVGA
mmetsp:Transcript_39672/g.88802  ORF Transcript_39672/g.88802 Transcript_39672/m.88802 type:complete len:267 (-) Transcript_39672:440-1240(-)